MKKIIGAAIGGCVHIGGLYHFLRLAETEGYRTVMLGPAVSFDRLMQSIDEEKPSLVAISYRLTPENAADLFSELKNELQIRKIKNIRFVFGGTPAVASVAIQSDIFDKVFDGTEKAEEIISYLRGSVSIHADGHYPSTLLERISQKYPYPLLRHHFGRPSVMETVVGIKIIAESKVLDVISIGPDQNAQQHFFHPEKMDPAGHGAGGVPVRTYDDMAALYESSRCGNFPLMRCYAGTSDLLRWAEMSVETIHNAWAAIPLCWYSVLDGRSERSLTDAITENQAVMKWYAEQRIPVEVNEAHQWSLRDAHDSLAVTMAFLAAYNAKKMGVRHYIAQFMFNTPPGTTAVMDIAKMLAKLELIEELQDESFTVYREVRAGLAHFSSSPDISKGQLASSALISLALKPHILHVVGYSEGDHAVLPHELIESCNIVHGVLKNGLEGLPDMTSQREVVARKELLKNEANTLLADLSGIGNKSDDPLSDASVIAQAIRIGFLDTPHFIGIKGLKGNIATKMINGACYAVDPTSGLPVSEEDRIASIIKKITNKFK